MSILGTRVVRLEDPRFLRGEGTYIANLDLPGAVHVTYVRSTLAHGRVVSVDASAAAEMPGVVAVFTGADVDLSPVVPEPRLLNKDMVQPFVATDTVRFVGEVVAVVVSETPSQGADAAAMVEVDYDPLPNVLDPADALAGETLLHDAAETNVDLTFAAKDDDDIFSACEVVVELALVNQKVATAPLEVRSCAARWDGDSLTQWACSQGAHGARDGLAKAFGVDPAQVRVVTPDVGGGFGAKSGVYVEEILVGWVARKLGRPARWTETRTENMLAMGHGRAQQQRTKMGGTRDGRITAYRLEVVQDAGAYPKGGAVLPYMTRLMAGGVYDIDRVQFQSHSVVTNTSPVVAYRGAGRPEATAAIERTIDVFAGACGIDPAEVRRRNYLRPEQFPLTTAMGAKYDSGEYEKSLDAALAAAGYAELRDEQRRRRQSGDPVQLGIGVSTYVETTNPMGSGEFGAVEITSDGGAIVRTGSSPHGQGHHTSWAMIVSHITGIPVERIEFRFGDTSDVARGGGTGGSRSLQVGGTAAGLAAEAVVERARQVAASLLEAAPEDVVIDTARGVFHVQGSPQPTRAWAEVAAAAVASGEPLSAESDFKPEGSTFPFGSHVSVVEVDTETGQVAVRRH
ncbi:MAG: hypothetical protein RLY50_685, partial [Actinomycetota bacterium]